MHLPPALVGRRVSLFAILAAAVFCLAAFNLSFRQNVVTLQQWDESLYATTAWEMLQSGDFVRTTFAGQIDYYNTKPPLNVWLIALSFTLFGVNLVALRIPSLTAAFATVVILVLWARRHLGERTALFTGLVIATTFGYYHVHGSRQANTDAINTLLIVLIVIVLWAARERPWRLAWTGPLLASVFLLRGMAVLLPLAIIVADDVCTFGVRRPGRWAPTLAAVVLFALPVGAWIVARWQVDQWTFLSHLFWYDFVARAIRPIEDHRGTLYFYASAFVRRQPGWVAAVAAAVVLWPVSWVTLRSLVSHDVRRQRPTGLLVVWAVVALAIPSLMRTKVDWYLHPFYPVFAIAAGALFANGTTRAAAATGGWRSRRARGLIAVIVLGACVAQARILWYSSSHRELSASSQGLLLAERHRLKRKVVYRRRLDRAEIFVLHAMVGGTHRLVPDRDSFLREARGGDFYLADATFDDPRVTLISSAGGFHLYEKVR